MLGTGCSRVGVLGRRRCLIYCFDSCCDDVDSLKPICVCCVLKVSFNEIDGQSQIS